MNQHTPITLEDLALLTQEYVNAVKRLQNLCAIDAVALDSNLQMQWLIQVDATIPVAAYASMKLGGPNDTTLLLPCQRPELKTLYAKYELVKGGMRLKQERIDSMHGSKLSSLPKERIDSMHGSKLSPLPMQPPTAKRGNKNKKKGPKNFVSKQTSNKPTPEPAVDHGKDTECKTTTEEPEAPPGVGTLPPSHNASEDSEDSVNVVRVEALCDTLRDLVEDHTRLIERIDQLGQDQASEQNQNVSASKSTLTGLEYNFNIYAANNAALQVMVAHVTDEDCKSSQPSISERLDQLENQAVMFCDNNTLLGATIGLKRHDTDTTSARYYCRTLLGGP
ncbi:hypothetical protein BDW22DRAFT_1156107 [Trametopsis cervina]|nr:hypothetical protein BDW22DRAFT_1156107 [Trametopsis cervina]